MKPDLKNIRDLNLEVAKLTTVQAIKLSLWHKIRNVGMICFAKPGLTEDSYTLHKEEFSITCYMCDTYTWRKAKHIHEANPSSRQRGCYIRIVTANVFFIRFVRLLALWPLLAYCASLGWEGRWLWRSRWNVDWQGKPKFSEETCPSATFVLSANVPW
jgi:hypothetical protein